MKKFIENFTNTLTKIFFPFYKSNDIKLLFKCLEVDKKSNEEVAMFVGGCVRNYIQSKPIDDIDIATIFTPQQLKEKLKNSQFKVIETGLEHGSVTVVSKNYKFELTSLRKDLKTDGRHAEIEIIDNWQEDSKRRDFTMNAIYLSKKGKIFDPQQGVNDLKNNVVKFIGDPQTRIEEDFLRIIRFLRFSTQYSTEIETTTINAIKLNLSGIKNLSKERILSELLKIIKLKNFSDIINNKELLEIFELIFPEFKNMSRLGKFKSLEDNIEKSEILFLSILLIDSKKSHEYFIHKYNTSNKINEILKLINKNYENLNKDKDFFKKNLKRNIFKVGVDNMKVLLCLYLLDKKKFSEQEIDLFKTIENITIPKFPYDGKLLLNRGFKEGKKIGTILSEAEKIWLQKDFNLSKDDFEKIIKYNS